MVRRLTRSSDAQQLQSSSPDSWPGFEEPCRCPDSTPGTSCSSDHRSPGSQGLGQNWEKSVCGFCKQNGESAEIYESHRLKAHNGRVLCPVLRKYMCPICGATGDTAHTLRYCPARTDTCFDVTCPAVDRWNPKNKKFVDKP